MSFLYTNAFDKGTFIDVYTRSMQSVETAGIYDFWCALWLLSTIVGRHTIIDRPNSPLNLNLYCIIAAESGITRKSTAIRHANKLLKEVEPDYFIVEGGTSPERLQYALIQESSKKQQAHAAIIVSELISLMGRQAYTMALPGMLTDLFDCPKLMEAPGTFARGHNLLRNVYITFLAGSTPTWLLRNINPDVIEGGFTSRVLFVSADKPKKLIAWGSKEEDVQLHAACESITRLRDFCLSNACTRQLVPDNSALREFTKWYTGRTILRDAYNASFAGREHDHVLRVAGLLSINDDRWRISRSDITNAIRIVLDARSFGHELLGSVGRNDRLALGIDRLRTYLIGCGRTGSPQTDCFTHVRTHLTNAQMKLALEVMHELGMVQRYIIDKPIGRKPTIWAATDKITKIELLNSLMDSVT